MSIGADNLLTAELECETARVQVFGAQRCRWLLVFLFLVGLRLFLPFVQTDVLIVHERIVASLLAGQNWGRQAFIGSLEFPPLTSLGLMAANVLAPGLLLNAGKLLTAVAQAWIFCYFLRAAKSSSHRLLALLFLALLFVIPGLREIVIAADPNWIIGVPAVSAIFHITQWRQSRSLRDAIVCAVNCGFLAFAGLPAIIFALSILAMMCHDLRRFSAISVPNQRGVKLLIWTPFCYCFFLWLLWNWLIMGDMFFPVQRLFQAIASTNLDELAVRMGPALKEIITIAWGAALVLFLSVFSPIYVTATCLLSALVTLMLFCLVSEALLVYAPGLEFLLLMLSLAGLLVPLLLLEWKSNALQKSFAVIATVFVVFIGLNANNKQTYFQKNAFIRPHPSPEAVTNWVDKYWKDSRILVYGIRAGSIYSDLKEHRFVANLDFQESRLLEQAENEQLHILLPPRDGVFYASDEGPFSEIHKKGKPWLLLEKQWANGWQLWRVVIPPHGESKLQG